MPDPMYAFVRNPRRESNKNHLGSFSDIVSAESHAKRKDATSQARQVEGRSHTANYFWSKMGDGLEGGGADYSKAYRKHKKQMGVKSERKNAALGVHTLVCVSPEWLEETGDPRDLANIRVQQLIAEAKLWAESWMGEGAVWAVRYDTDEAGSGIVDILASPIRTEHHKSGSSKLSISVRKANNELAGKHGVSNGWTAQQTDWAKWAQNNLDNRLKRGKPKKETGREHVPPDLYKEMAEQARQEAVKDAETIIQAEIDQRWALHEEHRSEAYVEAEERAWERVKRRIDEMVTERASERLQKAEEKAKAAAKREKALKRALNLLWTVLRSLFGRDNLAEIKTAHEARLSEPEREFKLRGPDAS